MRGEADTQKFFDEMAVTYDDDLVEVGWDPIRFARTWPFSPEPGEASLDAGCGTGLLMEEWAKRGVQVTGFDLSEEMVLRAEQRPALRRAPLIAHSASDPWPYPNDAFDAVVSLAILEFVRHLRPTLGELARVLKPGGRGLFTVEALRDAHGFERPRRELRYALFPLYRRTREEVVADLPAELDVVRYEQTNAYTVVELGFTCAYHTFEVMKRVDR